MVVRGLCGGLICELVSTKTPRNVKKGTFNFHKLFRVIVRVNFVPT